MSITNEEISTFVQELKTAQNESAVWDVFNRLCDFLIDANKDIDLWSSALPLLADIEDKLQDNSRKHYIKALQSLLTDKKTLYITEIEQYIQMYIKKHCVFTCEQAFLSILDIIACFSKDNAAYDSNNKRLLTVLNKHIPQSAFYAYVSYLTKSYQNKTIEIKVLRKILEIDPDWYIVHIHLGDIYYDQQKWHEAIECYEAGINAGDMWKNSELYFNLAWAYDKTKQYAKSIENYRKCLELSPNYRYANNNLGLEYKKIKEYEKALIHFDMSIVLGTDGSYPFRNKLETLIKSNRNDEAIIFATENSTHFATKYYRELLAKASGGQTDMDILVGLEKTTANEHAGTIEINDGHSGLQLYAHQQDAIRDMSRKILSKDKYAGLLVLPTGGGKTLTANLQLLMRAENMRKGTGVGIKEESAETINNSAYNNTYVVFDIETTGFSAAKDRITEIGAAKIANGKIVETFGELINPQISIPRKITEITGITDDMVRNKKPISDVLPRFLDFCKGSTLVAHNAKFDVSFIKQNAVNLGLGFEYEIVDTLSLARELLPHLANHKLQTVANELKIDLLNAHRATDDATATAKIFLIFIEMQSN